MENRLKPYLADIGNTHIHLYNGSSVEHLPHAQAIEKYKDLTIDYISVNNRLEPTLSKLPTWCNISSHLCIEGEYPTMGIDRKALCLSHSNGLFIDAGSAITVDLVKESIYQGGFILPGLQAYLQSYQTISSALKTTLNTTLSLDTLPLTTKDGISYGIIASIQALIEKHAQSTTLYFTGGDGTYLSHYFKESIFDETLVFQGMQHALKDRNRC